MAKIALYTLRQTVAIMLELGVWGPSQDVNVDSERSRIGTAFRELKKDNKPAELIFPGVDKTTPAITIRRHGKQVFQSKPDSTGHARGSRSVFAHSIVVDGVAYDDPVKQAWGYEAPVYVDATSDVASCYMNRVLDVVPVAKPAEPKPRPAVDVVKPHPGPAPEEEEAHVARTLRDLILNVRETERQARELEPPSITASLSDADAAWAAYREDHRALSELANEQLLALGRLIYANEAMVLIRSPHRPKDLK